MLYNLILFEKLITKFKGFCFQLSLRQLSWYLSILYFSLKLFDDNYYFYINFSCISNLFNFSFGWSKNTDHAGINFDLNIIWLMLHVNWYDTRHWDDENDYWQIYDEQID